MLHYVNSHARLRAHRCGRGSNIGAPAPGLVPTYAIAPTGPLKRSAVGRAWGLTRGTTLGLTRTPPPLREFWGEILAPPCHSLHFWGKLLEIWRKSGEFSGIWYEQRAYHPLPPSRPRRWPMASRTTPAQLGGAARLGALKAFVREPGRLGRSGLPLHRALRAPRECLLAVAVRRLPSPLWRCVTSGAG